MEGKSEFTREELVDFIRVKSNQYMDLGDFKHNEKKIRFESLIKLFKLLEKSDEPEEILPLY